MPDFELPDQHGTPRTLSGLLADGPVVLFFYPAAMSSGCTKESCHFRDLTTEFAALGAQPVGISTDTVDAQLAFDKANRLGYPLLSDVDGKVAESLGVRRRFLTPVKRATFVIDPDRRIRAVFASELSMTAHADRALETLRST
ncbi:redoxin domain-containing protein [Nakamurella sp. YIM 132087]|uniref:thioredoxin-dependent peroxiredoxin n=1 Tax=Nakamurella alba TaxID=2665158 RepID=A0A7K1FSY6_9ACTN|nr:redoxin domain-containing protein [Nakamurella alba]